MGPHATSLRQSPQYALASAGFTLPGKQSGLLAAHLPSNDMQYWLVTIACCAQDRGGTTVEDLCRQIHKSLVAEYSYSLVWGTSSKHYPQR